jgi:rhomboid family protein
LFAALVQAAADVNGRISAIGASGAIAGVLGAYLMVLPTAKIDSLLFVVPVRIPSLILIGQWIVFQFVNGRFFELHPKPGDNIAYYAHLGGVVAGLMSGLIYRVLRPDEFENEWAMW